jgi:hypothetical protein
MRRLPWITAGCLLVLGSLGLASCATEEFKYVPSEQQATRSRVKDEAIYNVPEDSPDTSVRVESSGIEEIKVGGPGAKEQRTLHLKLAVSNKRHPGPWTLNTRELSVSFPNAEPVPPILTQPGTAFENSVAVAPGELKTLDLFFPLPGSAQSSKDLPEFDFHWKLRSGKEVVQHTTLFDRVIKPEYAVVTYPSAFYPYYFGVGPVWYGGVGAP